ncbi:MAG: phosphonate metabolism protein/1,5-bisphosphokinase (PRPP-forming) PhnN [Rubrivivax sp.]|nr:phosphonate metabolism protein/1,5-bisphosphokinase (PRPP-forming) PhnN [Rubrivivax sp.]
MSTDLGPALPSMTQAGTLFLVVGPSGAGKDSVIDGLRARLDPARFVFARRVITRSADAGGEAHEACEPVRFDELEAAGAFLACWRAHGLAYGLPAALGEELRAGRHVIANASRGAVATLVGRVAALAVLEIDAPPDVIAARLQARGRETAQDIAGRIARPRAVYPDGVPVLTVCNDLSLAIGVARAEAALWDHLGEGTTARRAAQAKVVGRRLRVDEIPLLLSSITASDVDVPLRDALLVACANDLDDDELLAVARWRAGLMPRVDWGNPIVVDKHSLGGTAGSRVTMVVIPIVAAHGLPIPKTSSRAITSASGTADAMEVLARVDLTRDELQACVARARGCIAWNGRLNHSVLDEAMHRLEHPLRLDTRRWSAASILSKKHSAGATHIVIDIPYAPGGKVGSLQDARALASVFESLGARLGMTVRAHPTDGSAPIGRGIGPALEVRDVLQVLDGDPTAPADLREKSLFFASRIIALDPALAGDEARAEARAQELLQSGAARAALDAMVDAQGRREPPDASGLIHQDIAAVRAGTITRIHAQTISAIARGAGAPADSLAGVDLLCRVGERVEPGQALYRIQGCDRACVQRALALAGTDPGFEIEAAV